MAKNSLKLLICRTCARDNPGPGIFSNAESLEKEYRQHLKQGLFSSAARIEMQNCFSDCENFHCVQLTDQQGGFRLKKVSTPEKVGQVVDWVKDCQRQGRVDLPEQLKENLLQPIKLQE